ncbi:hypothetical protein B0H13DRAFT_830198 [Mycena leptocephala]|nr:hypothetical protein B0H13DRAFT_830198 [Mycena leptocephala]
MLPWAHSASPAPHRRATTGSATVTASGSGSGISVSGNAIGSENANENETAKGTETVNATRANSPRTPRTPRSHGKPSRPLPSLRNRLCRRLPHSSSPRRGRRNYSYSNKRNENSKAGRDNAPSRVNSTPRSSPCARRPRLHNHVLVLVGPRNTPASASIASRGRRTRGAYRGRRTGRAARVLLWSAAEAGE